MEPSAFGIVTDNPIFVKHLRSRLRPSQCVPGVLAVVALCVVIIWVGVSTGAINNGFTLNAFLVFAMIALGFIGGGQIGAAAGGARESGILDFHRVSPLPAWWTTLGFFFGAPIREYLYFAVMFPFMIFCAVNSPTGLDGLAEQVIPLVLTCWMIHGCALLTALIAKKPRTSAAGIIVLWAIFLWIFTGVIANLGPQLGFMARVGPNGEEISGLPFFRLNIHPILYAVIYEGASTVFLLIACARKMRTERAHAYSKPVALVCMSAIVFLALGATWSLKSQNFIVLSLVYGFVVAGIILATTMTPDLGEYTKGVRRALKQGHRRPPLWSDAAVNTWGVAGLMFLTALGATIAWEMIEGMPKGERLLYSQTIAIGAFMIAYYAIGLQFFLLRFGRRGDSYFRAFLFLAWVLPLLAGAAAGWAAMNTSGVQAVLAASPLAGIALSVNSDNTSNRDLIRICALLPSVTFASLFFFFLIAAQRRTDFTLRRAEASKAKPEGPAE